MSMHGRFVSLGATRHYHNTRTVKHKNTSRVGEKALEELGVGLMRHASTTTLPRHEYGEVGPAVARRRLLSLRSSDAAPSRGSGVDSGGHQNTSACSESTGTFVYKSTEREAVQSSVCVCQSKTF